MVTMRKVDGSVRRCDLSGATIGSSLVQQHNRNKGRLLLFHDLGLLRQCEVEIAAQRGTS